MDQTPMDDQKYFMAVALLMEKEHPESNQEGGACVVKDNNVIAVGFTQWILGQRDRHEIHAEVDAILNRSDVKGCTLYVTCFPCNECVKHIVQAGIKRVVYLRDAKSPDDLNVRAAERMLQTEGVESMRFPEDVRENINLRFDGSVGTAEPRDHDRVFMALARLTAKRSPDPRTQVGACLLRDGKVISFGWNQMPNGHNDAYPWTREPNTDNKHLYVCHAELNAIVNCTDDMKGCTMYVTLHPCDQCAKRIIKAGITEVVYLSDEKHEEQSFIDGKDMIRKMSHERAFYRSDAARRGDPIDIIFK